MRFLKNVLFGLRAYWKALIFIKTHRLYYYILIPAILMLGIYKVGDMIRLHQPALNDDTMNNIVWSMIRMILEILIGLTLMKFSKYLVVILLSPLLSFLSMKSEKIMTGNTYPFDLKQLFSDIKRGIRIAVRNIMWHYFFFMVIFFVAWLGWKEPEKSPVFYLSFVLGFYYYGFSFIDYVSERLRFSVDDSILFMRKHRGLAISIGMIYSLMILVPVDLGILFSGKSFADGFMSGTAEFALHFALWICAASAPILAIVAATIAMHDVVDLKSKSKLES
jgi:CysZ protein